MDQELIWEDELDFGYENGLASTFGYNDPEDNGIGAWGDSTNNPDIIGVALPRDVLNEYFGDEDSAHNALVELYNPTNGAKIQAPIVDKGPANWVIDRQGPTIDLTEGARRAIGMENGLSPMQWKIVGGKADAPPGLVWEKDQAMQGLVWEDKEQPAGLVWEDEQAPREAVAKVESELPDLSPVVARELGLQRWRDQDTGLEVRRAIPGEKDQPTQQAGSSQQSVSPGINQAIPTNSIHSITRIDTSKSLAAQALDLATPSIETARNIVEHGARFGKSLEQGGWDITKGFYGGVAAALSGERNPYIDNPELATSELPVIEGQIATEETKWAAPDFRPTTEDIDKIGYLRRRENYARKAVDGSTPEGIQGQLSRKAEGVAEAAGAAQAQAAKKWQPYIDKLRDKEFGVQLVESIGQSLPSTAAAVASPVIGISAMFLQEFGTSRQEYVDAMQKKGIVLNKQEADMYAWSQAIGKTPWEAVGDIAAARGLKAIFKGITPEAMQSVETFGKWVGKSVKQLAPGILGESLITTPAQSVTQDVLAEKAGIDKATTTGQKAAKAIGQIPLAATQSAVMFGAPASVVGGAKAARGDFDTKMAEAVAAKPGITVEQKPKEPTGAPSIATEYPSGAPDLERMRKDFETYEDKPYTPIRKPKYSEVIDEPTSDAELDRLQKQYETFGARSDVFRQSRSEVATRFEEIEREVDNLSQEELEREFKPTFNKFKEEFSKVGITTEVDYFAKSEVAIAFTEGGAIYAVTNPNLALAVNRTAKELGMPRTEVAIGEETIHAAHLIGLKEEWQKSREIDPNQTFIDFVRNDSKNIINGIRLEVSRANKNEQEALLQTVADSWYLYTKPYDTNRGPAAASPGKDIFNEIDFADNRITFVAEFLRQAKQLEKQGVITEETSRSLWQTIGDWVRGAISRVKTMLPGVKEGKFGESAQKRLQRIDDILAGNDVEMIGLKPPPPKRAVVNIGLATNDGKGITKEQALEELKKWDINVIASEVRQSDTEQTLIATLNRELTPGEAHEIAKRLNQDAIAQKIGDKGALHGPGKMKPEWGGGVFNPEYFLEPTSEELGTKAPRFIRSINELEKLAKDNESFKNWYGDFEQYLNNYLGDNKEYAPILAEFIAATSPNQNVPSNAKKAFDTIKQFIKDGTLPHGLPAHIKNLERATRGEPLSGPKVSQFSPAIFGDPNAITVDRHIAQLLFNVDKPTSAQMSKAKQRIIQIANRLGWTPRDTQAALWAANIRRGGKQPQSYDKYLEQYRDELNDIFTKDRSGAQRGIQSARAIRERISKGGGSSGSVGRVFLAAHQPAKQQVRPIINRVISPIVDRSTSLEGKGSWHLLPVPPADPTRMYKGISKVFRSTEGLEHLGKATLNHVDRWRHYVGKFSSPFRKWEKKTKGAKREKAHEEFKEHWENKTPASSPEGKELIATTERVLEEISAINKKLNIPLAVDADNFPASIKPGTMKLFHNPSHDPGAMNELMDAMASEGIIPPGDHAAMLRHIDKFNDNFKQNGFFGEWNAARNVRMPKKAYDHSFDSLRRFIISWSERAAQIEAFGKRGNDLFDKAEREAGDKYTADYIKLARRAAYNETIESGYGKLIQGLSEFSTGAQLGMNPKSTLKNWVSGMIFNAQQFGAARTLGSLVNVRGAFRAVDEACERGILLDDMMNIMHDGGQLFEKRPTATFAGASLRIGGFNAAESWVRGVSLMGAKAFLRSAIRAYENKPTGIKSRQYLGYFKRLGLPAEELVLEGGKGELTDRFLRAAVNEIQGGYTYEQLPAFQSDPVGRFLLKYRKWGTQQLSHFISEALRPLIRATTFRQLAMESVDITNPKTGKKESYSVPGAFLPAIRYMFVLAAGGAGIEWTLEQLFGILPKTASIGSIMRAWRTDQTKALGLLLEKVWGWHLQIGSMGLLSEYLQLGVDVAGRRPRSVLEPPGLDPIKQVVGAGLDMWDQGDITPKDMEQFMQRSLASFRSAEQMSARAYDAGGKNVFGKVRALEVIARKQDLSWLKAQTRRFNKEIGVKPGARSPGGFGPTEDSPFRDALFDDLITGDVNAARARIREHTKAMSLERKAAEMKRLKASMLARQPIRAGAGGGDPMRGNFLKWAERNLAPEEIARTKRLDRTYRDTARKAELMKPESEEPDEDDLAKAMRRIEILAE